MFFEQSAVPNIKSVSTDISCHVDMAEVSKSFRMSSKRPVFQLLTQPLFSNVVLNYEPVSMKISRKLKDALAAAKGQMEARFVAEQKLVRLIFLIKLLLFDSGGIEKQKQKIDCSTFFLSIALPFTNQKIVKSSMGLTHVSRINVRTYVRTYECMARNVVTRSCSFFFPFGLQYQAYVKNQKAHSLQSDEEKRKERRLVRDTFLFRFSFSCIQSFSSDFLTMSSASYV